MHCSIAFVFVLVYSVVCMAMTNAKSMDMEGGLVFGSVLAFVAAVRLAVHLVLGNNEGTTTAALVEKQVLTDQLAASRTSEDEIVEEENE